MFRKVFTFITIVALSAVFCGCSSLTLDDGKYETSLPGREDFAAVYKDLIFIRLREPADDPARNNYWIWAGKFSIEDDGHIILDMDKKLAKKWDFSYDLYRRPGSITVHDLGAENYFDLKLRVIDNSPVNRKTPPPGSGNTAPGSFPVYR